MSPAAKKALSLVRFDGTVWGLSGVLLLLAALFWLINPITATVVASIAIALPCAAAVLVAILCWSARARGEGDIPLSDIFWRMDLTAWLLTFCSAVALAGCSVAALTGSVLFVGTGAIRATFVTALMGLAAGVTTLLMPVRPIFEHDRLRVSSSSFGTQSVEPVEIILDEDIYGEMISIATKTRKNTSE